MLEINTKSRVLLIVVLVGSIAISQYFTEMSERKYHILYQGLFFLPVILAGFWFGLRGGLATSIGISVALIPFAVIHWNAFSSSDFNNIMEVVLYNAVGAILGILRDRELVQQQRLREAENLASMGRALSSLAHDMKTPLIAIGGFTLWVKRHIDAHNPCHEKLNIVVKETRRLENMVKDMLDFSKPLELSLSDESIDRLIQESLAIVENVAQERQVRIQSQYLGKIVPVPLDGMRIKQALINLVVNAVQASPEAEAVMVACHQEPRKIVIDVRDMGSGIAKDRRELIFSPFFTTKKEGTGLGLPIVKKIAEAHDGSLEILDNPDRGVTFRLILPFSHK
jgi:two-component system, NtrC family, sensor histidine kinase HydH